MDGLHADKQEVRFDFFSYYIPSLAVFLLDLEFSIHENPKKEMQEKNLHHEKKVYH